MCSSSCNRQLSHLQLVSDQVLVFFFKHVRIMRNKWDLSRVGVKFNSDFGCWELWFLESSNEGHNQRYCSAWMEGSGFRMEATSDQRWRWNWCSQLRGTLDRWWKQNGKIKCKSSYAIHCSVARKQFELIQGCEVAKDVRLLKMHVTSYRGISKEGKRFEFHKRYVRNSLWRSENGRTWIRCRLQLQTKFTSKRNSHSWEEIQREETGE